MYQIHLTSIDMLCLVQQALEERRAKVSVETRKGKNESDAQSSVYVFPSWAVAVDVLVWTNVHIIQWVESLGLADFATNLRESGVHGGIISLDSDFDHDKLAMALQIPMSSTEVGTGSCASNFYFYSSKLWRPELVTVRKGDNTASLGLVYRARPSSLLVCYAREEGLAKGTIGTQLILKCGSGVALAPGFKIDLERMHAIHIYGARHSTCARLRYPESG